MQVETELVELVKCHFIVYCEGGSNTTIFLSDKSLQIGIIRPNSQHRLYNWKNKAHYWPDTLIDIFLVAYVSHMPRCTKGTRSGKKDAKDTVHRTEGGKGSMGTRKDLTLLDGLSQSSIVDKLSHDGKGIWCGVGGGGGGHDDEMMVGNARR